MKSSTRRLNTALALAAGCQLLPAIATANTCQWGTGSGPMSFTQNVNSIFVPRDAAVGSVIGRSRQFLRTANNEGLSVHCTNDGGTRLVFDARASVPFFPGLLPASGPLNAPQSILQTNVPGVGVTITLGFPFDDSASNAFVPDTGDPTVPFSAHHERHMGATNMNFTRMESWVTLIKTGDIPPGPQALNVLELFNGTLTGIPGKAFGAGLTGTVIQAHCGSNRVSADPVQLKDWDLSDFIGPGYTTPATPFNITLSSCVADDGNVNVATANIRFEGAGGSVPVTPPIPGVFSLTPGSTAAGIGIQILRADGVTPVELNTEVPIVAIGTGDTVLDFTARFYQTEASRDVRAGDAKGTLNFTLTYK
ncbi:fimbrial protein [Pseudomonas umsongensis]|jgi:type 1 fimbria pilin|uniref:fimbrial protein n=1 Tax=Pseudomonas umsongensis TaxID=198618 RepID=UPI0015BDFFB5|nr:fimbrial protein [Pseudomonas umsongensis]